jgi:hypothetical protein
VFTDPLSLGPAGAGRISVPIRVHPRNPRINRLGINQPTMRESVDMVRSSRVLAAALLAGGVFSAATYPALAASRPPSFSTKSLRCPTD